MKTLAATLLLFASLASSVGCGGSCPPPNESASPPARACTKGRTFIVVRHAEKASADKDTPLSDRGRARAAQLAEMLRNAGVTRIVATQYKRTQETVAPLGERVSLPVEVRPADKTKDLVSELRASPDGSVIVVATHSNVVPEIASALTEGKPLRGVTGDALPDDEFGRVYVISEPCGAKAASLLELSSNTPAVPPS